MARTCCLTRFSDSTARTGRKDQALGEERTVHSPRDVTPQRHQGRSLRSHRSDRRRRPAAARAGGAARALARSRRSPVEATPMIGRELGQFEVVAKLGEGGMGEVYRARDTKLGRDVALKVIPDLFATDPERLARFEREAQVLASLNHPNIAHIYGVEESGAVKALVMELVEGKTL